MHVRRDDSRFPQFGKLRKLEPAEEEPLAPLWTMRKGFLFIGGLVTLCSVAFAAVIWIYRPAHSFPRRSSSIETLSIKKCRR